MENKILSKVFLWMFAGLLVTFITGYTVSINENMLYNIFSGGTYIFIVVVELLLVIILSARIAKLKSTTAKILFLLYSFTTGLTFGSIFVVYELTSIMLIFLITSLLFGVFALIGYKTDIDLSKFSTYLLMMLVGIIICIIINMFLNNSTFDMFISCISVIVFLGFTAYDIQKVKDLEGQLPEDNLAIIGALELYLDFINIFLDLLKLFGRSDD